MYAQCPECLTVYQLDTATLAQAEGSAGCGQCGATFNALATLTAVLPEGDFEILPTHPTSPAPPILMMAVVHEQPPQQALFEPVVAPPETADAEADIDTDDDGDDDDDAVIDIVHLTDAGNDNASETPLPLPSFARHRRRPPDAPRHRLYWVLACLVLAFILAGQLVWAERVPLTANASTRPWVTTACHWFGCTPPPVRDLSQLQLLSRDVRPHPSVPGALLISATLRNNASFTQPYPVVSITLSDLDQNRIAMRRFRPSEYMADPKVRAAGLAPGQTAALVFEVKDPGRNAVAFQFGFE